MFVVKLVVPLVPNFDFLWSRTMSLSRRAGWAKKSSLQMSPQLRAVPMHSSNIITVLVYGLVGRRRRNNAVHEASILRN